VERRDWVRSRREEGQNRAYDGNQREEGLRVGEEERSMGRIDEIGSGNIGRGEINCFQPPGGGEIDASG